MINSDKFGGSGTARSLNDRAVVSNHKSDFDKCNDTITLEHENRYGVSSKTIRDIWNRVTWVVATRAAWLPSEEVTILPLSATRLVKNLHLHYFSSLTTPTREN